MSDDHILIEVAFASPSKQLIIPINVKNGTTAKEAIIKSGIQKEFPEINIDKVNKISGMDISFVTTAETDKEAKSLLTELGLPFKKN